MAEISSMENTTQSRYCPIVFVLGLPGSGKGTLCKLVADQSDISGHRYCHISTGDYLRELCKSEVSDDTLSFDLNRIRKHLRESKLLPSHVLVPVLEHKISSIPKESNATTTWLIDGFPRNMETALVFEEKVNKHPTFGTVPGNRKSANLVSVPDWQAGESHCFRVRTRRCPAPVPESRQGEKRRREALHTAVRGVRREHESNPRALWKRSGIGM